MMGEDGVPWAAIVPTLVIFALIALVFAPLMTWVERKQSALMQDRIGANRADVFGIKALGLLHPLADAIKLFTKEDVVPLGAHRFIHALAPLIAAIPALVSFAVIPYGGTYNAWGAEWSLVGADLDYGILYVLAVGSLATYGSILAGWASNNNWGMLGSLRVTAQMLSYEVSMGISLVGLFMIFGTLRMTDMGYAQQETFRLFGFVEHLGWVAPANLWLIDWIRLPLWGIVLQPLAFVLFLTAIMAENKRPPFDTPEGEAEIVAGYFIEYSGMKYGLYTMGEFIEVVVIAGLMTALFLGGWSVPYIQDAEMIAFFATGVGESFANIMAMGIHVLSFLTKVVVMIVLQMAIRWSVPRFRYDQVMDLGWKILLPLSILNIVVTGVAILLVEDLIA
jgi:NADH-quinone oxidoreductase subunit H